MEASPPPGLIGSARGVLATLLDMGRTRLQLASTELEEERLRLVELFVCAVAALYCLGLGLVLASVLAVVLAWDGPRVLVLSLLTAGFLGAAALLGALWHRKSRRKPALLAATLEELRKDGQALQGRGPRAA